jgi:hypothetical protein
VDRVFVGSDETGYYREPNYEEVCREVRRLESVNAGLLATLEEIKANAEQYLAEGVGSQVAQDVATLMIELASAAIAKARGQG